MTRKHSLLVVSLVTIATIASIFANALAVFANPAHANPTNTANAT